MVNEGAEIPVQVTWQINTGSVPVLVNQILIQEGSSTQQGRPSDEFYLTFGHVTPPPFIPGPDGTLPSDFSEGLVLPVLPIGQFAITLERLVEFRDVMDGYVKQIQAQRATK